MAPITLEDRFEVIKEIGDGSFGSVALARVRTAGAHVARRGTMVAIKTMKKTFDSFSACLELREVIFLRSLPTHPHLVPALDIFLDPLSKKLHIVMEYMDGNLYQLIKARDNKYLDGKSVKSILYQILSGLDHIHAHNFFHRDIKPENILVSGSAPIESSTFGRYSTLVTPPSTPPTYTVKIADFGLARETHSKQPYTTYVSTRWYRAPEVLLRASSYSAPVDMWGVGAMAVEIATLKPLFPGGNEVDQVWRICEIMGSPGNWYSKSGAKIGGGEWREGTKLAQKLGFSFPKMAPHSLESILQPPYWPQSLSQFVTWCLMWDPKNRPTSAQALNHEYFADAVDPLRPKSSTTKLLGRKQSDKSFKSKEADSPTLTSKSSWFRRSIIGGSGRDSPAPVLDQDENKAAGSGSLRAKVANKRATWTNGAPIPILPSIRPVSPLSNAVTAQANSTIVHEDANATAQQQENSKAASKKIGRQLSLNSTNNHYADIHRQEAERALNGGGIKSPPPSGQKEGFFAHLRKRARRLSGRNQMSLPSDDLEANAGCAPWSNRLSMVVDTTNIPQPQATDDVSDLDKALQSVRYSIDSPARVPSVKEGGSYRQSMPRGVESMHAVNSNSGSAANRPRRMLQMSMRPTNCYETPEEEEELLHEVLHSTHQAAQRLGQADATDESLQPPQLHKLSLDDLVHNPYPTPSPSSKQNGVSFPPRLESPSKPVTKLPNDKESAARQWPTPPYDDGQWASSATASIFAAGSAFR
ncbi:hypothetical protein VTO42DRAFT_6676 [Malbranchea cinnamomea]